MAPWMDGPRGTVHNATNGPGGPSAVAMDGPGGPIIGGTIRCVTVHDRSSCMISSSMHGSNGNKTIFKSKACKLNLRIHAHLQNSWSTQ